MKNNTAVFLEEYKRLEQTIRDKFEIKETESATGFLSRKPQYKRLRNKLEYCQDVRNLSQHIPQGATEDFLITASDLMITFIRDFIKEVEDFQKCKDIWVSKSQIYYKKINDLILPTMLAMRDNTYTHVPILNDNDKLIGVFSENTIFQNLLDNEIIEVTDKMTFETLKDYLSINNHISETFIFVPQNLLIEDLQEIFEDNLKENKRIGMVFCTANGKESETILGILTSWDIVGK